MKRRVSVAEEKLEPRVVLSVSSIPRSAVGAVISEPEVGEESAPAQSTSLDDMPTQEVAELPASGVVNNNTTIAVRPINSSESNAELVDISDAETIADVSNALTDVSNSRGAFRIEVHDLISSSV
jgi:hypothetical protein